MIGVLLIKESAEGRQYSISADGNDQVERRTCDVEEQRAL